MAGTLRDRSAKRSNITKPKEVEKFFDLHEASNIIRKSVEKFKRQKLLKPEPYRFFLKENFNTASWGYRPPHYIIVGFDIFKEYSGDEENKEHFFQALVYHEIAHSLYTDYRTFKVVSTLEERDLPFSIFNLFEDARIEDALRRDLKGFEKFGWSKYMPLGIPMEPLDLFYWIIQTDGDKERYDNLFNRLDRDLKEDVSSVWKYYERTINAKNTFEVIDIVEDWMKEFQTIILTIGHSLLDGEIEVLNSPNSLITQSRGGVEVVNISVESLDAQQNKDKGPKTIQNLYSISRLSSVNLLSKKEVRGDFDKKLIQKIIQKIEKLFLVNKKYLKTSSPSKRLALRNILLNNPNRYRKKNVNNVEKKKVAIILDISGSMSGIMEKMLILVEVFNILAKKGVVEGYLMLSASFYKDLANYQTFKFPLDEKVLKSIVTYGVPEGLDSVMQHLTPLLKPCDFVLVFTDGFFADDPLNKPFFKRNKIDLYGVFLDGISKDGHGLEQYFDKIVVDDDIEQLAYKLVEVVK